MRWNIRLGPLQLTSPVGVIGFAFIIGVVLCCCGAGFLGACLDDDKAPAPAVPVVETSTPGTPSPKPTKARRVVTPGAYCDTAGATGVTATGRPMVCRGPG